MKRISIICLALLFIANSASKGLLFINYWYNKETIITNCCINKNKPELKCEGKCYISSEIKNIDHHTSNELPNKVIEKEVEWLNSLRQFTLNSPCFSILKSHISSVNNQYMFNYTDALFKPPTV